MEQHNLRCQIYKQGDDPDAKTSLKPPLARSRVRAQSAKLMVGRQIADVKQKVALADQEIMQLQLELERVRNMNAEKRARNAADQMQQQQTHHAMGEAGPQLGAMQQMQQPATHDQRQAEDDLQHEGSPRQQDLDGVDNDEINQRAGGQGMDGQGDVQLPGQIDGFHGAPEDDGDQM